MRTVVYENDGEHAEYWVERGMIHFHDYTQVRNGRPLYGTISILDLMERLSGLNAMIGNSRRPDGGYHRPDECNKLMTFIEKMVELAKRAQAQGDPNCVKASAQKASEASLKVRAQKRILSTPAATTTSPRYAF